MCFYSMPQAGDRTPGEELSPSSGFSRHLIIWLSVCFGESIVADQFRTGNSGSSLLADE